MSTGTGTPVHAIRADLGKERRILDDLRGKAVIREVGTSYYPRFLAVQVIEPSVRDFILSRTALVLAALKEIYRLEGPASLRFPKVVEAVKQLDPAASPEHVNLGLLMALDFTVYVPAWSLGQHEGHPLEGVLSLNLREDILDYESLEQAWESETLYRTPIALRLPHGGTESLSVGGTGSAEEAGTPSFPFMKNDKLRVIVERDLRELGCLRSVPAPKSTIILAGSLIEALLLDVLQSRKGSQGPSSVTQKPLEEWGLAELIEEAVRVGLITSGVKGFGHAVREYRNLVHPGNEIRSKATLGKEEAEIAEKILEIVLRDLQARFMLGDTDL